jgi:hypothetical protein
MCQLRRRESGVVGGGTVRLLWCCCNRLCFNFCVNESPIGFYVNQPPATSNPLNVLSNETRGGQRLYGINRTVNCLSASPVCCHHERSIKLVCVEKSCKTVRLRYFQNIRMSSYGTPLQRIAMQSVILFFYSS